VPLDDDPESAASGSSRIRDGRRSRVGETLKYLREVKAREALLAAGAVLIALAAPTGAAARTNAHRRHVEVRQPTSAATIYLGEHDGYEIGIRLEEPGLAELSVFKFVGTEQRAYVGTTYGAHFHGSPARGRVTARFGSVGSISVRFRPDGKGRTGRRAKNCRGARPRDEFGSFDGRISLRGEGGYFEVSSRSARGDLSRTFTVRCRVRHPQPFYRPESLRERVAPRLDFTFGTEGGSLALLLAYAREGGREVAIRAAHMQGSPPGAELEGTAFEYQGEMPVGRIAESESAPPGTLLTSLPGEHPATATIKPPPPFSGEGIYLSEGATSHSWTGTLAVQFPGLPQPLVGPGFYSSLCVVSSLVDRDGCDFVPPNFEGIETPTPSDLSPR
jgi:hypothetical protein